MSATAESSRLSQGLVNPKEHFTDVPSGSVVSKSQPQGDTLQVLVNISSLFANNDVVLTVQCVNKILLHIIYALSYLQCTNMSTIQVQY